MYPLLMASMVLDEFRHRVEDFLVRTSLAPSRFGLLACNDPAFVQDLRAGREPRLSTIEKVDKFMNETNGVSCPPQAAE